MLPVSRARDDRPPEHSTPLTIATRFGGSKQTMFAKMHEFDLAFIEVLVDRRTGRTLWKATP